MAWTEEEDALLIHELKGGARYKNVSEKLPGRTLMAHTEASRIAQGMIEEVCSPVGGDLLNA
jgi:hypothetical protein